MKNPPYDPSSYLPMGGPYAPIDRKPLSEDAQIDLAYQRLLGRSASPEEIQQWLSGAYGHGQSGNLAPIFDAIRQSQEAQSRPPMVGGPGPGPRLPRNTPMPIPGMPNPGRPRMPGDIQTWRQGLMANRAAGEAQGMDMSWMDQPNALMGPAGPMTYDQVAAGLSPAQGGGRRSAKPLAAPQVDRMRKAILGVPEE